MHNDAVESTVYRRNASRIARLAHTMRTPMFGVRAVCARRAICELLRRQTIDSTASLHSFTNRAQWCDR
eukprot:8125853-Lingulodinium_polyedra.AAC.1